MTMQEQWRPVPDFPDYEVSDQGRVCSHKGRLPRVLACPQGTHGYRKVTLRASGRDYNRTVHVLVAEVFLGTRPPGLQVRHLDGNQLNNRASNLAWGTAVENAADKKRHGTEHHLRKTHCPQGHPYTGEHLYMYRGGRKCRTCSIARVYARRAAAKQAAA